MTLNEKLENFKQSAIEDATNQSVALMEEADKKYQEDLKTYKSEAEKKADFRLKEEAENLLKIKNQKLSTALIDAKRVINNKSNELKEQLFYEVEQKLQEHRKTPEYFVTLKNEISNIISFAKDSEVTIYIDADDYNLKDALVKEFNCAIEISPTKLNGGTKAIIHNRNILIDNSFASKLAEEKSKFSL